MNKQELEEIFIESYKNKMDVAIEVTIPHQNDCETIINKNKSILNKLDFYKKAYTDNLVHSMND